MRYYIVDNQGNEYGNTTNKEKANNMLADTITQLQEEHTEEEVSALELEVIESYR